VVTAPAPMQPGGIQASYGPRRAIDRLRGMTRDTLIVPVQAFEGVSRSSRNDPLAVEEPLEIRLNGSPISITMRTPGDDLDLAAGFLFTEGIIDDYSQILSIRQPDIVRTSRRATNSVHVCLRPGIEFDSERLTRNFYATSSCGVCGKASIETIEIKPSRRLPKTGPIFEAQSIHGFPEVLRQSQRVFERTGGLHAAALFSADGTMLALREDVGRHNAVDKLIGFGIAGRGLPFGDSLILVSGRAGFELVQKAAMAGIPILAAVGAPSSLAVEAALHFRMTLLGFVRARRFNSYSEGWRIQ
jgi:FdhD protein